MSLPSRSWFLRALAGAALGGILGLGGSGCDDFAQLGRCANGACDDAGVGDAAVVDAGQAPMVNGAATSATAADAGTITLNLPPGADAGDLLLVVIGNEGGTFDTIDPPADAGWSLVPNTDAWIDTTGSRIRVFYAWAGASEPPSQTFSVLPRNDSPDLTGTLIAIRGANRSNPINASGSQINGTVSASCASPTISTTVPNTLLVFACEGERGTSTTSLLPIAPPTGMTERSAMESTGTYKTAQETATGPHPSAGAVQASATLPRSAYSVGVLIGIAP